MIRTLLYAAAVSLCVGIPLSGQENTPAASGTPPQSAVARVDPAASGLSEDWLGRTRFTLALSQGVPFRVFTLDAPRRLVLDFKSVDWSDVTPQEFQTLPETFTSLQFGPFQSGWSRLVAELSEPLIPDEVEVDLDAATGAATLSLALKPTTARHFSAKAGAPQDALWTVDEPTLTPRAQTEDRFIVVIDPGHGGIDPGAERDGITEKALMLEIAVELQTALLRAGVDEVVLTRQDDVFVSLTSRVALAHQTGADVFISLHADALIEGGAEGATIYTLSEEATDKATEQLAARHNRADIIAGADLTGSDDEVAGVLLDLARQETEPRTVALAQALVTGMTNAGGPMNRRPLRQAGFSVLKSADIPSVLLEVGFLSSERDLENLLNPAWRARMLGAVAGSIVAWRETDAALRALMRQ